MDENLEILMPVHNEARILPSLISAIDKKIGNTINYSFITSEDGSTDNSPEVLNELKKNYPIKIISEKKKNYIAILIMVSEGWEIFFKIISKKTEK